MKRAPLLPVVLAGLVSVLLVSSAFLIQRTAEQASALVTRGLGDAFSLAAHEAFRGKGAVPTNEQLAEFLQENHDKGLRFIGITEDNSRAFASSAGSAVGEGEADDQLVTARGRTRMVQPFRLFKRENLPAFDPQKGPPRHRIVLEFEPVAAFELQRKARFLLGVAVLAAIGIMGLAIGFTRILRQREGLQSELERGKRLAALGTMSAVLAHELRNPLASLKGHAQLLSEDLEKEKTLHAKSERVVSEAVRLEQLLNDLLLFVKGGEVDRKPVDAVQVFKDAVAAAGPETIKVAVPSSAVSASLDRERMSLALQNVLRNAVQAGGEVEAELRSEGGAVSFLVRDRGAGIPAGEEEKIFEPFVTNKTRGVGLGLAITRRIVEQHKGTITGRNREGGGAEFIIRVPAGG